VERADLGGAREGVARGLLKELLEVSGVSLSIKSEAIGGEREVAHPRWSRIVGDLKQ
jgi:hypothetical protein